jgi:hypothetical protein
VKLMTRCDDPVMDTAPAFSRWWVLVAGSMASALVNHAYRLGRTDGSPRSAADVAALRSAVDLARDELGSYRELIMKHEDVLPPTPALWQLIGWCASECD